MNLPTDQEIESALKSLWARLTADLNHLWANDRFFLIGACILVVLAKGANLMISLLAEKSKLQVDEASVEDAVLKAQEDAAKTQANALVQQANALPNQEKPVDSNWDKK